MNKLEEVKAAIPHREPFLFVDEIVECEGNRILCKKTFHADNYFFAGHYPGNPIVPGVLQCEAAMQAGAILLTRIFDKEGICPPYPRRCFGTHRQRNGSNQKSRPGRFTSSDLPTWTTVLLYKKFSRLYSHQLPKKFGHLCQFRDTLKFAFFWVECCVIR